MTNDLATAQAVLEAFSQTSNVELETLQLDATLKDLGLDSVSVTSIILALEVRLGFEFNAGQFADLFQADRVRDFIRIVEGRAILATSSDAAHV